MQGAAFYDAGVSKAKGARRVVVFARRLLRRILRPMLLQLDAEVKAIAGRQDQMDRLEQQLKASLALGWDHTALARRLAVIEDRLEEISSRLAATDQGHLLQGEGEYQTAIRYLGPEDQYNEEPQHLTSPKSKAG